MTIFARLLTASFWMIAYPAGFSQDDGSPVPAPNLFNRNITDRYALHFPAERERIPIRGSVTTIEETGASSFAVLPQRLRNVTGWDPLSRGFLFSSLRFLQGELDFRADGSESHSLTVLSNGLEIRSGYNLKAEGDENYGFDNAVNRASFSGPFGLENREITSLLFPGSHDKSAYLSNRVNIGERVQIDAGARYEQPALSDKDHLLPRFELLVKLTPKLRLFANYGKYAEFTGIGDVRPENLTDASAALHPGLAGLGSLNLANGGLDSVFPETYQDYAGLGLERDLNEKTTLRMESYQSRKNTGFSFQVKTKF